MKNTERKEKPWPCQDCGEIIGYIVFGELFINGNTRLNTDGKDVITQCTKCGAHKIWYSKDRLSELLRELARELSPLLSKI